MIAVQSPSIEIEKPDPQVVVGACAMLALMLRGWANTLDGDISYGDIATEMVEAAKRLDQMTMFRVTTLCYDKEKLIDQDLLRSLTT
jgi:hypothetical protein